MRLIVHTACFQEWCMRLGLMLNSKIPNCAKKKTSYSAQMVVRNGRISWDVQLQCSARLRQNVIYPKNSKKITSEKRLENIWKRKHGIWEIAHLSVISCKATLRVDKLSSNMLMFIGPADCRMVDCWSSQTNQIPDFAGWFCIFILHLRQTKFTHIIPLSSAYLRSLVTSFILYFHPFFS